MSTGNETAFILYAKYFLFVWLKNMAYYHVSWMHLMIGKNNFYLKTL